MKQFDVYVTKKVGALADICELLARSAINIRAISTDGNTVRLVTEDEKTTMDVLKKARLNFTDSDILSVRLIDRPGELAKVARVLAREGISIESVYILDRDKERGETEIALKVDNLAKARKMLK